MMMSHPLSLRPIMLCKGKAVGWSKGAGNWTEMWIPPSGRPVSLEGFCWWGTGQPGKWRESCSVVYAECEASAATSSDWLELSAGTIGSPPDTSLGSRDDETAHIALTAKTIMTAKLGEGVSHMAGKFKLTFTSHFEISRLDSSFSLPQISDSPLLYKSWFHSTEGWQQFSKGAM